MDIYFEEPKTVLKRLGIFCLILAGTILVTGSLIFWQGVANKNETVRIPKLLAGVGLSKVEHGVDAVKEITQLHQKDLGVVNGAMGVYGNHNQITIWAARFATNLTAGQMVSAMREKISPGKSPFLPNGVIQNNGRTIYKLDGMGQKNFYFQSDDLVIWLSADGALAEQALKDILIFYP